MKAILMFFGYAEYHAECLAPVMWTLLLLAILSYIIGVAADVHDHKRQQAPRQDRSGTPAGTDRRHR